MLYLANNRWKDLQKSYIMLLSLADVSTCEDRLLNRHYPIEDMSKLYLLPLEATREVQLNPGLQTPT